MALPDLEQTKSAVLNSLTSKSGQRTYDHAITEFVDWYCSEPRLAFNRTVVLRYRIYLEQRHLAATTINLRLAAIRRVAYKAADSGLLSPELAAGIRRVKGVRRIGLRLGNWLTADQGKTLLATAHNPDLRSKRNYAILAVLLGCGLRRGEVLALTAATIQVREERDIRIHQCDRELERNHQERQVWQCGLGLLELDKPREQSRIRLKGAAENAYNTVLLIISKQIMKYKHFLVHLDRRTNNGPSSRERSLVRARPNERGQLAASLTGYLIFGVICSVRSECEWSYLQHRIAHSPFHRAHVPSCRRLCPKGRTLIVYLVHKGSRLVREPLCYFLGR